MLSAELGRLSVLCTLLSYQAHVDTRNEYGYTALHLAAEAGHTECVTLLIQAKSCLDLPNKFGKTALIVATENGHLEIVQELCQLVTPAVGINIPSRRGFSPLMIAAVRGDYGVVQCLTANGADINLENKDKVSFIE